MQPVFTMPFLPLDPGIISVDFIKKITHYVLFLCPDSSAQKRAGFRSGQKTIFVFNIICNQLVNQPLSRNHLNNHPRSQLPFGCRGLPGLLRLLSSLELALVVDKVRFSLLSPWFAVQVSLRCCCTARRINIHSRFRNFKGSRPRSFLFNLPRIASSQRTFFEGKARVKFENYLPRPQVKKRAKTQHACAIWLCH